MADSRNPDIEDWNRISDTYAELARAGDPHAYPRVKDVLWESLGELQGLEVLDLGCGHGWLSQKLASAGARVLGIDGSGEQLAKARAASPSLEFIQHDLSKGLPPLARCFDRILSNMVLMDVSPLEPLVADIADALATSGRLIFTIPHPCFFNQKIGGDAATGVFYRKVTGYLEPEVWRIDSFGGHNHYHRSLSYYFELLREAGLAVSRIYEPPQEGNRAPEIPLFLLIEALRIPHVNGDNPSR